MKVQQGATLVELVISVVIISISVTGIMMVIANVSRSSADPMIRVQAMMIAQAYMEEVLAQPLVDASGIDTGGPEAGETRATYDDLTDYNGLNDNTGARDQSGNLIAGLDAYNVSVSVVDATLSGEPAKRVRVLVTYDGDVDFNMPLSSYRLN